MSKENVEIVKRFYAETEQGNFGLAEFFAPDVRIVWLDNVGIGKETVGLVALGEAMRNWLDAYEDMRLTAEKLLDAGDDVVAIATWRARGRASGVVTEWRHGNVWTVEDGRITAGVAYEDPRDALEAAGLSE